MLQYALAHWNVLAAAAGVAGLLIWQFWPSLSKLRLPLTGGATKAEPSRLELLQHLDAAYEGFRGLECEEGMAGVRALIPHAYHEHEHHA